MYKIFRVNIVSKLYFAHLEDVFSDLKKFSCKRICVCIAICNIFILQENSIIHRTYDVLDITTVNQGTN